MSERPEFQPVTLEAIDARVNAATPERWCWIPDFEGRYEVSTQGRVRSYVGRKKGGSLRSSPRLLAGGFFRKTDGYVGHHLLSENGRYQRVATHRIVLLAFVGPPPSADHEACHLNGVKADNRLENLMWGTHAENEAHKVKHGTTPRGDRNGGSRWTEHQVILMRLLRDEGADGGTIGRIFGATHRSLWEVLSDKSWTHLETPTDLAAMSSEIRELRAERERLLGFLDEPGVKRDENGDCRWCGCPKAPQNTPPDHYDFCEMGAYQAALTALQDDTDTDDAECLGPEGDCTTTHNDPKCPVHGDIALAALTPKETQ